MGDDASSPADGSGASSGGSSSGATGGNGSSSGGFVTIDSGSGSGGRTTGDGGEVVCPTGLKCNVACPAGSPTTISGTVYDPAMKNPLYNIAVYVPQSKLQPLPAGVPMGADACNCGALFKSGAVVGTTTDVEGHFVLDNAPTGQNVPLVLQVGKWRHVVTIPTVTGCMDNAQPDKSLALNGTVAPGSDDNMPDIAVSTGHSDTLECLMSRIGLPASEYVAGTGTTGHVHIFSGGNPALAMPVNTTGGPEITPMPGAPESDTNLWDTPAHLMPYDIVLLSCEGAGTYNANPSALEQYLNAGGRAFASHFHYQWFNGSPNGIVGTAPTDWGSNLASWSFGAGGQGNPGAGQIVQTLNVGGGPFVKGQAMDQWLGNVGALGQNGVPAGDVSIYQPKFNAIVGPTNTPSQPWITQQNVQADGGSIAQTMYFSFDTPVNAASDGGTPQYCGRAVYSDLHVDGSATGTLDTPNAVKIVSGAGTNASPYVYAPNGQPPPQGCAAVDLSPQEKVLEFMIFDLSSCVVSDTIAPPTTIPVY